MTEQHAEQQTGQEHGRTPADERAPAADGAGVLVTIPTYNERDNLPDLVARLHATVPRARVLVVDDGSPDGTGALADGMAAADPRVAVLHRTARAGLGAAYVDAFSRIVAEPDGTGPDGAGPTGWVVQMDADGSHAPEDLPRLLAAAGGPGGADLVLGSRYVPGGRVVDWPWHREVLSRGGNAYSRRALRLPIRDVTGGYRLFRRSVLAEVGLRTVSSQGYCFQVDLVHRVATAGFRVREVPITFVERARGESKMSGAVVREALWRITSWGVRLRLPGRAAPGRTASGRTTAARSRGSRAAGVVGRQVRPTRSDAP